MECSSYFLMKGMEGEADKNQDNKITAGELASVRPKQRSPAVFWFSDA